MLIVVVVWFAMISSPAIAFVLARNGQIQIGDQDGRYWRLFLVQELESEGLGLERARPVPAPDDVPETVRCNRTSVGYLMWVGEGQSVDYCLCVDDATGSALPEIAGAVCNEP